jgi:RNA-directed DNA polymerase
MICSPGLRPGVSDRYLAAGQLKRRAWTPGADRVTVSLIVNRIGVHEFLSHIRKDLKSGSFQPVPVRQVMISKASGKLWKLGIPTVADRVVQAALKLVP